MRYNLENLEWQQFEQLAFNCLQKIISPSISFIEGGTDKGRDFEYEGITSFFDEDSVSKRYIFQAKHKTNIKYRAALKNDLLGDLNKVFIKNELTYDFYCLVTNLPISGNFFDELNNTFLSFVKDNKKYKNVKFRIISYRHLETAIDKYEYIKLRYASILNPKDLKFLLSKILKKGEQKISEIWLSIFKRNAQQFIYTSVQDKAIEIVKEKSIILFSGPPKSGKTFNAQALILRLCFTEGFTPIFIVDLNNFEKLYTKDTNQIFLFDDAFGKHNLDKSRSDILERKLEQIFESIDKNHLFVFTSREYIYRSFQSFTDKETSKFIQKITVKVTELTLTEKESLFERYYKVNLKSPFKFEETEINTYIEHDNFSPETIRSYFENIDIFNKKDFLNHLERPDQYLATVFKNFTQEKQQTLLAILFGLNGKINNISYAFKNILSDSSNTTLVNLQEQLQILEDSIISFLNGNYSFYHPSMTEFFLRYLSLEAGNYRSLALKNINIDLLGFIRFSKSKNSESNIKINTADLPEISIGFERIISNPNSKISHLNSIFTWVKSEDVQMNLQLKDNSKYKKLKTDFLESFSFEAERILTQFDVLEFDYLMRTLNILYSQKTLAKIFDRKLITKTIHSKIEDKQSWIVVFQLIQYIESKDVLLQIVDREWLNKFYSNLKKEIYKLGFELFGDIFPDFQNSSFAQHKQKTNKKWYPRYLQVKRKMAALKNSKPHGLKIYRQLEKYYTPLVRLEENQRNRYFFLLEKGIW